ncbi:MAG: 2-C-methyl-D-erythritol 4-phosphate cytidylyltransferase, partial [Acholeplasmatales bacterium]|nr:2-C-methyl-D-erythritol 4-phosphate cytidylyltransferase [Acholeplasmatales bacterium]
MTAIILAAGTGKRSQQQLNKVLVDYQGEPLFLKTVKLFLKKGFQVIVVINKNDEKTIKEYYQGPYVYGGVKR